MAKDDRNLNIVQLRPSQLRTAVEICASVDLAAFIHGPPGIGKSEIVRQLADDASPKDNEGVIIEETRVEVFDLRLLLCDPTDLKGIPFKTTDEITGRDTVKWATPDMLPPEIIRGHGNELAKLIPNNKPCVLFLDELTAAPPSVQAAAYQLVLDRRVGNYRLPVKCAVIAAGNRTQDKGIAFKMPTPLANRFSHFELVTNWVDWSKWAISRRIHPDVVSYLSENNAKLFDFKPKDNDMAFPTPRSWSFVSKLLYKMDALSLGDAMIKNVVSGAIGSGAASDFIAYRSIAKDVPKIKDILSGKAKKMRSKNISAQYFLSTSLTYEMSDWYRAFKDNKKTAKEFTDVSDNYFNFIMDNFKDELVVMSVRSALRDFNVAFPSKASKGWSRFFDKHGEEIIEAVRM